MKIYDNNLKNEINITDLHSIIQQKNILLIKIRNYEYQIKTLNHKIKSLKNNYIYKIFKYRTDTKKLKKLQIRYEENKEKLNQIIETLFVK